MFAGKLRAVQARKLAKEDRVAKITHERQVRQDMMVARDRQAQEQARQDVVLDQFLF